MKWFVLLVVVGFVFSETNFTGKVDPLIFEDFKKTKKYINVNILLTEQAELTQFEKIKNTEEKTEKIVKKVRI